MNSDPLFMNKVIGAVLFAGLIAMTGGFAADMFYHPQELESPVYAIGGNAPAETQTAEAPAEPEPIAGIWASADVAAGEKLAKKCTACHSFDKGGPNKVGPNLWGVVGGARAQTDGFSYSSALREMGGTWSVADLNAFLFKPKQFALGTKMNFVGFKKPEERAEMVRYMRDLSDSPIPLE
ncbi:MAG: cytochrome c family protein [Proteobacteria bacterium]|nr:cytochrome c family protein [Pseudomonadota bacterium]